MLRGISSNLWKYLSLIFGMICVGIISATFYLSRGSSSYSDATQQLITYYFMLIFWNGMMFCFFDSIRFKMGSSLLSILLEFVTDMILLLHSSMLFWFAGNVLLKEVVQNCGYYTHGNEIAVWFEVFSLMAIVASILAGLEILVEKWINNNVTEEDFVLQLNITI